MSFCSASHLITHMAYTSLVPRHGGGGEKAPGTQFAHACNYRKVPVKYRPNAAFNRWSYGRDLASLP